MPLHDMDFAVVVVSWEDPHSPITAGGQDHNEAAGHM